LSFLDVSEDRTRTEALRNIQDAITLYLEDVEAEAKEMKAKLVQVTAQLSTGSRLQSAES